jgi:hypothetical protein
VSLSTVGLIVLGVSALIVITIPWLGWSRWRRYVGTLHTEERMSESWQQDQIYREGVERKNGEV